MKRPITFGELFGAMSKSKAPKECLVRISDSLIATHPKTGVQYEIRMEFNEGE